MEYLAWKIIIEARGWSFDIKTDELGSPSTFRNHSQPFNLCGKKGCANTEMREINLLKKEDEINEHAERPFV